MPSTAAPSADHPPGIIQAQSLDGLLPGLVHGFSTNFYFAPNPSVAAATQGLIAETLGCRLDYRVPVPVMLEQPHSTGILDLRNGRADAAEVVTKGEHGSFLKGYDGAFSDVANPALLGVRAADCVPVLAVHTGLGAYAALHAGWRGAAAGILPNLLGRWAQMGGHASGVRLAFGPSIGRCCFEVRGDCLARFEAKHLAGAVESNGAAQHLDLARVLVTQAGLGGVSQEQIETLPYCTYCHEDRGGSHPFASYRRAGKQNVRTDGRNVAFIGTAGCNLLFKESDC